MKKTRTITIGNGITLTGTKSVEKYENELRKKVEAEHKKKEKSSKA